MTYSPPSDLSRAAARYLFNARFYLENAYRLLEQDEVSKAGEFVWGSMAAAVKAVAAYRGRHLRTHRQLTDFASGIARELNDKGISDNFIKAQHLHSNFYEADLEKKDVLLIANDVRDAVWKLINLIPTEARQKMQELWDQPLETGVDDNTSRE